MNMFRISNRSLYACWCTKKSSQLFMSFTSKRNRRYSATTRPIISKDGVTKQNVRLQSIAPVIKRDSTAATSASVLYDQNPETNEQNVQTPVLFIRPHNTVLDTGSVFQEGKPIQRICREDVQHILSVTRLQKVKPCILEESEVELEAPLQLQGAIRAQDLEWTEVKLDFRKLPRYYMILSKFRLSMLVVTTSVAGYVLAPAVLDPTTLLLCALGTGLTSCSANAINQLFEIPFDSQMARTRNRVLVTQVISPLHAATFAAACGVVGLSTLYYGVNGLTATLGASNLVLYTLIYTPLKRFTIANTWVGAVVGAIPPVMGWVGCTGCIDMGAFLLGGILYSWQFTHFNALSWNLRHDYSRAGYQMMAVNNPDLCRRTALRYSIAIVCLCTAAPMLDVTTWTFALDSLPLNTYFVYLAWKFHQEADSKTSRKLFRFSLIHLPLLLMFMFISKKYERRKDDLNNVIKTS